MRYAIKWPQYAQQWNKMEIKANRVAEFNKIANTILVHKDRYVGIEKLTGVPWHLIALLHMRESSFNFNTYLGNGQTLSRPTTIVPAHRGPFLGPDAFEKGAVDALRIDGLSSIIDWRLEKELYEMEIFNGTGYDGKGLPSPYVFGGTNIQHPGKYVADHVFDPHVWDPQPGCAPILATLAKFDSTIKFIRES